MGTSCWVTLHLFLVFLLFCLQRDSSALGCQTAERVALLKLKHSLADPSSQLSSWTTQDCCQWNGVRCDNLTGHVHHLDLRNPYYDPEDDNFDYSRALRGKKLDPSLAELTQLRYLDVSGNDFSGSPIPSFLGSLKNLMYLNLSCASFSGVVPPQLGNLTKLEALDLYMMATGYYVTVDNLNWVARLSNLASLNLGKIDLDENSTRVLARLPALLELRIPLCLRDAQATRAFYNASWLSILEALDLSSNELEASSFPHFFSKMTSLRFLDLSYVDLSKAQDSIGVLSKLPFLLHLHFSGCQLGNVHLKNVFHNSTWVSTLEFLDISSNEIEGPIPSYFTNMSSLRFLDLSSNHFNGSIPLGLRNMRAIESIHIEDNNFDHVEGGTVMGIIGNLCKLKTLDFSRNSIEAEIIAPHDENISHCRGTYALESLNLFANQMKGALPYWLGLVTSLKYLNLGSNQFHGQIPASFGNLTLLKELDLSKNVLSGTIVLLSGGLSSLKAIDLSSNSLEGSLSRMSNLSGSYLEELDLSSNGFTGNLPQWLGELPNLRHLHLYANKFFGQIPSSIGSSSSLVVLELSRNNLSGNIPQSLGKLASLAVLDLSHNQLGQIPPSIGQCNKLEEIRLSSNHLQGPLSNTHLANLSVLRVLDLSDNFLRGHIPESLGQCSRLEEIDLSSNFLVGLVSEYHLANLSNLFNLDLSSNPSLNLNLSSSWMPPFQLNHLSMSSCNVQGKLPRWLLTQNDLFELDLSKNEISGEMPEWTWKLNAESIDLSHNRISGPIPHFQSHMYSIDLSNNFLSGSLSQNLSDTAGSPGPVPTTLCQLRRLDFLYLQNNSLSGTIPSNCWSFVTDTLYALNLSYNKLSGLVPMSVGQLLGLSFLHLNHNAFKGEIPPNLSRCTELVILDLGENKLSGSVPRLSSKTHPNLRIIRLRGNQLEGSIPLELCSLPNLQILDLANNNLSGRIPECFGHFDSMKAHLTAPELEPSVRHPYPDTEDMMEVFKGLELHYSKTLKFVQSVDLSCNNLVGPIPQELTNLSGLVGLNLSYNHLSGTIPDKIGRMKYLESLDLANNNLSGIIPLSISELYSLSYLNLSYNKLRGEIPTGRQLQALNDPTMYADNPGLCGDPLPNKCWTRYGGREQGGRPGGEARVEDENDTVDSVVLYGFAVSGFVAGFWGVVGMLLIKKQWRIALFRRVEDIMDYLHFR